MPALPAEGLPEAGRHYYQLPLCELLPEFIIESRIHRGSPLSPICLWFLPPVLRINIMTIIIIITKFDN